MDRSDPSPRPWNRQDVLLWLGLLAGPIAFAIDEIVSYAVVSFTSSTEHGQHAALYLVTALSLLATLTAFFVAFALNRRVEAPRAKFMALGGVLMSAFFAVVIVAEAIPKILLRMGE